MKVKLNLFATRKYMQLYLKVIILVIIIVLAVILLKLYAANANVVPNVSKLDYNSVSKLDYNTVSKLDYNNVSRLDHNHVRELDHNHIKNASFILALNYYEQLTCATHSLFELFNVAQNFDAKVVIPYLSGSTFHGIPNILIYHSTAHMYYYPLYIVYNIHKLNETFHSLCGTYFATFVELIKNAPRNIVVIDTLQSSSEVTNGTAYTTDSDIKVYNCKSHLSSYLSRQASSIKTRLDKFTEHFSSEEFIVRMYICILPSVDTTTDEIKGLIGEQSHSIIFTQWRGCAYHSCDIKASHESGKDFRHRILYHSNDKKHKMSFKSALLPYNDTIKINAKKFLENIKISSPYISIHIRTEKLAMVNAEVNGYTDCCLSLLGSLMKSLKNEHNINSTITITDVGEYGSMTCHDQACLRHGRKIQKVLSSMGLAQVSYDPLVTGGIRNSAYVSLVEMDVLAMGDLLIVLGKGSFKNKIITQFLQSNSVNKVYYICTEHENKLNEFSSLDKKCL